MKETNEKPEVSLFEPAWVIAAHVPDVVQYERHTIPRLLCCKDNKKKVSSPFMQFSKALAEIR